MNNGQPKQKGIVSDLRIIRETEPWKGTFIIETPPDKNKNIWWAARCVDPDYINLFTAAPELLYVLQEVNNRYASTFTNKMQANILMAIGKAKGLVPRSENSGAHSFTEGAYIDDAIEHVRSVDEENHQLRMRIKRLEEEVQYYKNLANDRT